MPLYKHVREDLEKLTYIDEVVFKNARLYLHYTSDGKKKVKQIPYRIDKNQLLKVLEFIREDSDYYLIEAEKHARGDYNIKPKTMVVNSSD